MWYCGSPGSNPGRLGAGSSLPMCRARAEAMTIGAQTFSPWYVTTRYALAHRTMINLGSPLPGDHSGTC